MNEVHWWKGFTKMVSVVRSGQWVSRLHTFK